MRITAWSALIGLARAMGVARRSPVSEPQRRERVGGHERPGDDLVEAGPRPGCRADAAAHLLLARSSRPIASRRSGSVSGRVLAARGAADLLDQVDRPLQVAAKRWRRNGEVGFGDRQLGGRRFDLAFQATQDVGLLERLSTGRGRAGPVGEGSAGSGDAAAPEAAARRRRRSPAPPAPPHSSQQNRRLAMASPWRRVTRDRVPSRNECWPRCAKPTSLERCA